MAKGFLLLGFVGIPLLLLFLHFGLLVGWTSAGCRTALHVRPTASDPGGRTVRVSTQLGRLSFQRIDLQGNEFRGIINCTGARCLAERLINTRANEMWDVCRTFANLEILRQIPWFNNPLLGIPLINNGG